MNKHRKRNTLEKYDDDNLIQLDDSIGLITEENDTLILLGHQDTIINDAHIVTDTFIRHDTLIIEKTIFDKEIQLIEKLMDRPDFGKSVVSILILLFVMFSVCKKWKCKKKEK